LFNELLITIYFVAEEMRSVEVLILNVDLFCKYI